ncbi:MAG: Rieske (2Fe-2S) protein [Planctomycetales bacterium]|nr:Rieske (2Fe-2S) protein [bacterium]UNM08435.1 MAG: Rieske (2Fe-2S) protein [Planctomycetales bacterium]
MAAHEDEQSVPSGVPEEGSRRGFLRQASGLAMLAALLAGYGRFASMAVEFLYPANPAEQEWQFVAAVASFLKGDSLAYRAPRGDKVTITRQAESGEATDFIALSSTCPHLGCQVHWEAHNDRYFCPCHNGVFDPSGKGIGGPPGEAGQSLPRFPLKVEDGLLYILVPMEKLPGGGSQEA